MAYTTGKVLKSPWIYIVLIQQIVQGHKGLKDEHFANKTLHINKYYLL